MKPFESTAEMTVMKAVYAAEAQASAAEAVLALADARVRLVDTYLATVRRVAAEHGIDMTPPRVEANTKPVSENISRDELAKRLGVSVRTVSNDHRRMAEGVHYHYHRRRVLYHWPEVQDFIRQGSAKLLGGDDLEHLAIDEVSRRRARAALRKIGGGR
jgi:hypothetical protein